MYILTDHRELDKVKVVVSAMPEVEFRVLCILGNTELYHQHKMKI